MSKKEQEHSSASLSQVQRDQREAVNRAFDQTRNNVKKTIYEAQKDISDYAQQFASMQEKAFAITGEIADNYIASQKELFNSFNQTIWTHTQKMLPIEPQHILEYFLRLGSTYILVTSAT